MKNLFFFGAMCLLVFACGSKKNLTSAETQEFIIPFVADSVMSVAQIQGRTFYTDSVKILLWRGPSGYVINEKTTCLLDTITTKGYVNGKEVKEKGYVATFYGGKKLFYMIQDQTRMPILTTLFNHPDSVMINGWGNSGKKEIWALTSGAGSRLFYDPNDNLASVNPSNPPSVTPASAGKTGNVLATPQHLVVDTIRGIDHKMRLVKPKS